VLTRQLDSSTYLEEFLWLVSCSDAELMQQLNYKYTLL